MEILVGFITVNILIGIIYSLNNFWGSYNTRAGKLVTYIVAVFTAIVLTIVGLLSLVVGIASLEAIGYVVEWLFS